MKTSHAANDCARAIVEHLEKATGKEIHFTDCLKIIGYVQLAIDSETAKTKKILRDLVKEIIKA